MAAPLSCPSCWCAVTAPPGHSGPTLECPVCGGEVPTPGSGPAPVPPAAIAVRPVSGPTNAPLPVARVVARPASPPPPPTPAVKPLDWSKVGADSPPLSRGKRRNSEADDSSEAARLGNGRVLVLVGVVAAGMLVLVGLPVVALVWMLSNADPDDEDVAGIPPPANVRPKLPEPAAPPAFDPPAFKPPVVPRTVPWEMPPRPWDEGWRPMAASASPASDGFTALVPPCPDTSGTDIVTLSNNVIVSTKYRLVWEREAGVNYLATFADPRQGFPDTTVEIGKALVRSRGRPSDPMPVKVGRYDGEEFKAISASSFAGPVTVRVVRVGHRVFAFAVGQGGGVVPKSGTMADREKKFFDSIAITFDPATPPGSVRPLGGVPDAPVSPPPTPRVTFPEAAPKLVATIPAFTTAVALPDRKEMLTFAPRPAPTTGKQYGLVRRYSAPGFKLLATYHLPAAVVYAAADETGGRLVTAAASRPDPLGIGDGSGRSVTPADVLIFDLKKLTDGSLAEKADVKPTATVTIPPSARVTGLELAKDGKTAYVGWNLPNIVGGRIVASWAGKVQRVDVAAGTAGPALDLPGPTWAVKLNADGTRLYAADHFYMPASLPKMYTLGFGFPHPSRVFAVDTAGWQLVPGSASFVGPAMDLLALANGRMVAVVPRIAQSSRVIVVDPAGLTTQDVTPTGNLLKQSTAVLTADGKRVAFGAMNTTDGITVWETGDFRPGSLRPAARAANYAGAVIAGQAHLAPGGTLAAFHTGQVIDLTASAPAAP